MSCAILLCPVVHLDILRRGRGRCGIGVIYGKLALETCR